MYTKGIKATMDPLGKFPNATPEALEEACGIIPHFILYALGEGNHEARPFIEAMSDAYGFGGPYAMGGTVTDEGVYQYPEDPDLYPYVQFDIGPVQVLIYPYAIVAVRDEEDTIVTRMD